MTEERRAQDTALEAYLDQMSHPLLEKDLRDFEERSPGAIPEERVLSQLDEAAWEAVFEEGQAMSFEEAIEYVLSKERNATPAGPGPDRTSAVDRFPTLSAREGEVAAMVARGMSNRRIAQELFLSERTIEKHVSNILRKLELASRAEIAAWATEQRLIAPYPDQEGLRLPSAPAPRSLRPNASAESRK
jgi:DNA-binding CsgD family transcriptional regulator